MGLAKRNEKDGQYVALREEAISMSFGKIECEGSRHKLISCLSDFSATGLQEVRLPLRFPQRGVLARYGIMTFRHHRPQAFVHCMFGCNESTLVGVVGTLEALNGFWKGRYFFSKGLHRSFLG